MSIPPKCPTGAVDRRLHGLFVRDVASHCQRLAAIPTDRRRDSFGGGQVQLGQNDGGALGRQRLREDLADAAPASGDEGHLAAEPHRSPRNSASIAM